MAFADASLMTQEENDAFQVLYQFGIFKGVGNLLHGSPGIHDPRTAGGPAAPPVCIR